MEFSAQDPARVARVLGHADAENTASTTTTDADSDVINLADAGYAFLEPGMIYHMRMVLFGRGAANIVYYAERHALVLGAATTPVVVNGAGPITVDTSGEIIPAQGVEIISTLAPEVLAPIAKVTSNEVIIQIDGDTGVGANWVLRVYLDPPVALIAP
jgi:hypothetical protein